MAITSIHVENFKSFDNLTLNLKDVSILIGSNASGKSNFIQIFKFIRNIRAHGLDNAIFMEGDVDYLQNCNLGNSKKLVISFNIDNKKFVFGGQGDSQKFYSFNVETLDYELKIKFEDNGYVVDSEKLILNFNVSISKGSEKQQTLDYKTLQKTKKDFVKAQLAFRKKNNKFITDLSYLTKIDDKNKKELESILISAEWDDPTLSKDLIIEFKMPPTPLTFVSSLILDNHFNKGIYDFDPRLSKKATKLIGKTELDEDGSNLSIVLKNMQKDDKKWESFNRKLRYVLPFVEELEIHNFFDKSMIFKMKEKYSGNTYLPAFLISDGTIHIACLIIALYYTDYPFVIIEEPEKNVHPALISKISELIQNVSQKKQIIITTHNPEFLKYFPLENILLVSRNNGFTEITRSSTNEKIKTFLDEEIGINQLFIDGILG